MKVLIATNNPGKVAELERALDGLGLEPVGIADAGAATAPEPEETGETFAENALIKARYYHELTGMLCVADDSGLEVDVLGGRPGVLSARYAPTDRERVDRLLAELEGYPLSERTARFVCALALVGENLAEIFTGVSKGHIKHLSTGRNGFGYDPVFVPEGETRSFAEMDADEKRSLSHRGRAVAELARFVGTPS